MSARNVIRHRLQTTHLLGPDHYVSVRSGWYGRWDVWESHPALGSTRHDRCPTRVEAEAIAAAVAAVRTDTSRDAAKES